MSHIKLVLLSYPMDIESTDLGMDDGPVFVECIAILMVKNHDKKDDNMLSLYEVVWSLSSGKLVTVSFVSPFQGKSCVIFVTLAWDYDSKTELKNNNCYGWMEK